MTYGCPHDWIRRYTRAAPIGEDPSSRVAIEPGWPLTLEEAADALRIKRRNARWISRQPIFQRELSEQLQALRAGMKTKALMVQGEIMETRVKTRPLIVESGCKRLRQFLEMRVEEAEMV